MPLQVKDCFPIFQNHPELVYLDSASTCQRAHEAVMAEQEYFFEMNANVHRGLYPMAEEASARYESVRWIVKRFLNARHEEEIVFTHGATEALNLVAVGWGQRHLKMGDEVILSVMEHHSHLVPWQSTAQKTGAILKFCSLTKTGDLDYEALEKLLSPRTKMIALTGLSNVLGTLVDLERVTALARRVSALVAVDGAQLVAHVPVDVQALDIDFLSFSSHKLYGPMGAGVLYAKKEHLEQMDPLLYGGDMIRSVALHESTWNDVPFKFEAGTPNVASVISMGASLEWLMGLGWDAIQAHEKTLFEKINSELRALPFIEVYGTRNWNTHRGAISFNVKGVHPHDVAGLLGEKNICVRAGHHCTMPLHQILKVPATVRASLGVYNEVSDIEALVLGLKEIYERFSV